MINIERAYTCLASKHHLLNQVLEKQREEWKDDGGILPTIVMGEFGLIVFENYEIIEKNRMIDIFTCVERLLTEGDNLVGDAVATGFLEAIVHRLDEQPEKKTLVKFFGMEARKYCIAYDQFLGVRTPGLYD